jgi:Uncharacterized protein conserved in bacteria
MKRRRLKPKAKRLRNIIILIIVLFIGFDFLEYEYTLNKDIKPISKEKEYYTLKDFGFITLKSKYDYNNNGIDDYTDILNGAKDVVKENPKYISKYYAGGYPPYGEGVCTDVIWRALKEAGYLLKDMMAKDIREEYKKEKSAYNIEIIDDNIDFRRVSNQEIFFKRYAESLTTDIYETGEFQPGDIVTFDDSDHIAMISDKMNKNGVPYLIQNGDEEQKEKEEDRLEITEMEVTGHYRFTYSNKLQSLINRMNKKD